MAAPSGAELREDAEIAGEGIADDEGFGIGIRPIGARVFGPEVEKAVGGSNGVVRTEGEEGEGEAEPVVEGGVEHVERREGRSAGAGAGAAVRVSVGGAEGEEGERRLIGGDEVEESRRRE